MKKALVAILAVVIVAVIVVGVYGSKNDWFGKTPAPVPPPVANQEKPKISKKIEPPASEIIGTQATLRLESLRKATPQDFSKALLEWGKASGVDRKLSWEAVCAGAKPSEECTVRMRACQLAQAMAAGRPDGQPVPPPADEKAVEPLIECLKSGDAGVTLAAVNALGTINLQNPAYKVEPKAIPEVKKLLAGDDPGLASAALAAAAFFRETGMAPDILAAWEKHGKAADFASAAVGKLKILMELKLRDDLKKAHSEWTKEQCLAEAKSKAQELAGQFGNDLAKWKAWWTEAPSPLSAPVQNR
jgi:hypothetical protein